MPIIPDRVTALAHLRVDRGEHARFEDGHGALELVAFVAGEPHGASPACVCPTIARLVRHWDAMLIAIGINTDGRRGALAVELAQRESTTSWQDFIQRLLARGPRGVEFVVSDQHEGLRQAIMKMLPGAAWQRCYVHFLRNALDHLPRKADDDCLTELRWIYDRRNPEEARRDLAAWLARWQPKYAKLCDWVEDCIEETLTFFRLPIQHHKHLRSSNLLERVNEEIKRRTHIVRVFPSEESCLRLVRALCAEIHEEWQEGSRYINMALLAEQKKLALREAA